MSKILISKELIRILSSLLENNANVMGNNISVFCCCHEELSSIRVVL